MKKILVLMLGILLITPLFSIGVKGGFLYGSKTIADSSIKDIFGNSSFYNIYLGVSPIKYFTIGIGKESNYNQDGTVGIYNDATNLKITSSLYFFGALEFKINKLSPYLKIGFYQNEASQTFDNQEIKSFEFTEKKSSLFFGGGVKFNILKNLNIVADVYSTSFKIKPFDETYDLGGLRFSAGIEYCLNF